MCVVKDPAVGSQKCNERHYFPFVSGFDREYSSTSISSNKKIRNVKLVFACSVDMICTGAWYV